MSKKISELTEKTDSLNGEEDIPLSTGGQSLKIKQKLLCGWHFSETEKLTGGTWIDGSPVYCKTLKVAKASMPAAAGEITIALGFDLVYPIDTFGFRHRSSDGFTWPINADVLNTTGLDKEADTLFVFAEASSNSLLVRAGRDLSDWDLYVTLIYTRN